MKSSDLNNSPQPDIEPASLASRLMLVIFCLIAGLGYRIIVGLLPPSVLQLGALLGLSVLFLLIAVFTRRQPNLNKYWEIPLAFFYLHYGRYPRRFEFLLVPSTDVRIECSTRGSKCE